MPIVTHTLVTSYLDYCNIHYMGLLQKAIQKLQLVQNSATWIIRGKSHYTHVALSWVPIAFRVQFKIFIITCKVLQYTT